jgi:hypothetical protein
MALAPYPNATSTPCIREASASLPSNVASAAAGILLARQMQCVRSRELHREIPDKALGEQIIGCAVAQSLAICAHRVEVQQRALDPASGQTSDAQVARENRTHLEIGEVANDDRGAQS